MTWLRKVTFTFSYQCCYKEEGNEMLPKRVESEEQEIIQEFEDRPTEPLDDWASRVTKEQAEDDADDSCKELDSEYFQCSLEIEIISTEEIEIKPPLPPCPKPVRENLEFLEGLRLKYTGKDKETVEKMISDVLREYPECEEYYKGIKK